MRAGRGCGGQDDNGYHYLMTLFIPTHTLSLTHSLTLSVLTRHPSNLMLDRLTGRILHIDFGDCFEVAMTREKFPEKIPFRLTRMLTNAMEVGGA